MGVVNGKEGRPGSLNNNILRRSIIFSLFGLLCFTLGWWVNNLYKYSQGARLETEQKAALSKQNPYYQDDITRRQAESFVYRSPDSYTGGFSSLSLELTTS